MIDRDSGSRMRSVKGFGIWNRYKTRVWELDQGLAMWPMISDGVSEQEQETVA